MCLAKRDGVSRQCQLDFIHDGSGLCVDELGPVVGEWMGDRDKGKACETQYIGLGTAERAEFVAANNSGRDSCFFQLNRVVDTPRRATTSIGNCENHCVATLQTAHHLFWTR
jgi:hypothetical protein